MKASDPQNDRELLLSLNDQIGRLSEAITGFGKTLKEIEEKKIAGLDDRLSKLESWKMQISGGWKLAVVLWTVGTGLVVAIVKFFTK